MGEIIAVFVCIFLNGILSLTEMAFVSVGKNRLRALARQGNGNAQRLVTLRDNPERTLSVLQIGISLLGAIAAATGGASVEEALSPHLESRFNLSENSAEILGIIMVVIPLTYLNVVLGELVPKTLALRNPLKVALRSAKWLALADRVFMPIINVLEWSTKKILSIIAPRSKPTMPDSEGEAVEIEHLSQPHRQYILNLVNIENKRIRDIYVPMTEVTSITSTDTAEQIHQGFIESGYTRLPVFQDGQALGVLHSKEFMALWSSGQRDWLKILRPVLVTQPHESLLKVLRMIQDRKSQMAIVKRGNEIIGIVTLEDIIEEIIGDVFDEDEDDSIKRLLSTGSSLRSPQGISKK